MKETGFLFDLDGVLIDSEREYTRIWEKIEQLYPTGIPDFPSVIKGMTLEKILDTYYADPAIRPEVEKELYRLEKEMTYRYTPGTEEFIAELIRRSIPRAVVTSSNDLKMAHLYADIPEFKEIFPVIVDSTMVTRSKPDPQGYLLAANLLNLPIENCVVFEDSVQGVKAGKAAGAYVVGVKGTKSEEELMPYSDIVIDRLSPDLIKQLEERK